MAAACVSFLISFPVGAQEPLPEIQQQPRQVVPSLRTGGTADFRLTNMLLSQDLINEQAPVRGNVSIGRLSVRGLVLNEGPGAGTARVVVSYTRAAPVQQLRPVPDSPGTVQPVAPVQQDATVVSDTVVSLGRKEGMEISAHWWPKPGLYVVDVRVLPQDFAESNPGNNQVQIREQVYGTSNMRFGNMRKYPSRGYVKPNGQFAISVDMAPDTRSLHEDPAELTFHIQDRHGRDLNRWNIFVAPTIHTSTLASFSWNVGDLQTGQYNIALKRRGVDLGRQTLDVWIDEREFVAQFQPGLRIHKEDGKYYDKRQIIPYYHVSDRAGMRYILYVYYWPVSYYKHDYVLRHSWDFEPVVVALRRVGENMYEFAGTMYDMDHYLVGRATTSELFVKKGTHAYTKSQPSGGYRSNPSTFGVNEFFEISNATLQHWNDLLRGLPRRADRKQPTLGLGEAYHCPDQIGDFFTNGC
jgi:hypothetical protein